MCVHTVVTNDIIMKNNKKKRHKYVIKYYLMIK
jgi:hypothetical protein